MRPRKEHTMRNILRTRAVVVIFLTGYFYILGKSNEGCAAEAKSPPIRQELVHEYARKQIPLARAAETVAQVLGDRIPEVETFAGKKLAKNEDALLLDFKAVSEA